MTEQEVQDLKKEITQEIMKSKSLKNAIRKEVLDLFKGLLSILKTPFLPLLTAT